MFNAILKQDGLQLIEMSKTLNTSRASQQSISQEKHHRQLVKDDFFTLQEKIFSEFDTDKNNRFSKSEFQKVISSLVEMVGGDGVLVEDVEDLFNLLDVNGDQTVDRKEFESVVTVFFKTLKENGLDIQVSGESDIIL